VRASQYTIDGGHADLSLAEVPDGEYLVGVIVDPENLFEETNDTNNKALASGTLTVGGGGTTSGVDFIASAILGSVEVTVTVSNNGDVDATAVPFTLYLSSDATVTIGDSAILFGHGRRERRVRHERQRGVRLV